MKTWLRRRRCGRCWRPRGPRRHGTRQVRARGHGHRPGGRRPGRRARLVSPARAAWRASPAGRRCRTSGCRRARTRSGSGSPCCGGSPTRPARASRTGRWRSWWRRSAACCSRSWPASATWSRSGCTVGQACELDDLLDQAGRDRLLAGRPGHRAAARSPSAAASSTCSRRPRNTRCGSSSSATRWRRSVTSRSPTSAASAAAERGLWAPPCRELLLTPAVRERAKELADTHPALADIARQAGRGDRRRRHGGVRARCWPTGWNCSLDYVPAGGIVLACDPERVRARAEELVRTSQEFLEASWVNAAGGRGGADRPGGRGLPADRADPRRGRGGRPALVDDRAVRRDRRCEPTNPKQNASAGIGESQPDDPEERASVPDKCLPGTCLSRRYGPHDYGRAGLAGGGLAGRAGHRGPRPGPAAGRDAPRRGDRRPAGRRGRSARARRPLRDDRADRNGFVWPCGPARAAHRERPGRASGRAADHQGHAADAEQAARRRRPAAAQVRRLRGARAARRRPVRGDDLEDRGRAPPGNTW